VPEEHVGETERDENVDMLTPLREDEDAVDQTMSK
jgi:hypothetical protein